MRHAPVNPSGYLYGSTDADIKRVSSRILKRLHSRLAHCQAFFSSPALRCIKTYQAVFVENPLPLQIKEFWEQDFVNWDGLSYSSIPDQGELSG